MNKPASRRLPIPAALSTSLGTLTLLLPHLALAGGGPSGGTVVAGSATISNPSANGTVIKQSSNSAVINWQQFSIGNNDYVQFIQPSSSSVVLNRVIGGNASQILGDLSANGRVFLINPNGVVFGVGSQVDVGGLVASTMNIQDRDFLAGHYVLSGGSAAGSSVVNAGTIKTADGGFVVLAGDYVKNTGVISSRLGQVVLASGAATTLDIDNSGLVSVKVDQATLAQKAGVDNAGQIIADGGRVIMTAKTAHDLAGSAVNNSGLVRAQGIANHGGEIELTAEGGDVAESGTLDASNASGAGGSIKVTADRDITIAPTAQILASGTTRGGDIGIVAQRNLAVQKGSLVDAHGAQGQGGQVELSGHAQTTIRGTVTPGSGGTLLIDPTDIVIADGSSGSGSAGGTQTVSETFVEGQLQSDVNLQLVASNSITMNKLTDGTLNGVAGGGGYGGSLLLGIGSITNGVYVEGTGGSILFLDNSNTIATYGGLKVDAGSSSGMVNIGKLISSNGDITIKGVDGITTQALTANNGNISLNASNGDISATSLVAGVSTQGGAANAAITVSAGGGVSISSINSGANHTGGSSYAGSATATVTVDSNTANLGHAVSLGTITATALSTLNGTADAQVYITDHSSGANKVNIGLSGAVVADAQSSFDFGTTATAGISIASDNGGISGGTAILDGIAYGGLPGGTIQVTAYNGGSIQLGAIDSANDNITVSSNGAGGNIAIGALSGNSYGSIAAVNINSAGSLTASGDISAQSIRLTSAAGNLSLGNLTANNGSIYLSDSGGSVATGSLTAIGHTGQNHADISVYAQGGITVGGNISTSIFVSQSTDVTANVNLQANYWSGGTGDLVVKGNISTFAENYTDPDATVTLRNYNGSINLGTSSISTFAQDGYGYSFPTDDSISLIANNGSVTAGNLTAQGRGIDAPGSPSSTTSGITVQATGTGGNISLGTLSGGSSSAVPTSIDLESSGTLALANTSLTAGSIRLVAGSGDLTLSGGLSATNGNVYVHDNSGSLSLGNVSATASGSYGANATVDLYGYSGLTVGTINTSATVGSYGTASAGVTLGTTTGSIGAGQIGTDAMNYGGAMINASADGGVTVNGAGTITLTGISTYASAPVSNGYANSASANVNISNGNYTVAGSTTTYYGGDISTGNIGTTAVTADNGSASAYVNVRGNYYGQVGGTIKTGTVTTSATGTTGADYSYVTLNNSDGGIDTQGNAILTQAKGGPVSGSITLTSTKGDISASDLTAYGGGVTVTSSGSGNISLGTLSGGSSDLTSIDLEAAGTLAFTNTSLSAGSIRLIVGSGDLSKGGMTATNGGVYIHDNSGSLTLGNVSTTAAASYGANANVDLFGYSGLTAGTITTNAHSKQYYDADATVTLGSTTGAIGTQAISTTALNDNSGNYAGSANAGVTVNGAGTVSIAGISTSATANGAPQYGASADADVNVYNGTYTTSGSVTTYYGGDVDTGTVSTQAVASKGNASALVNVHANYYGNVAGTINAGPITTQAQATGGNGTGTVTLVNSDGGINLGSNAILAQASGGTATTDIKLSSSAGGVITTGNLTTGGGEISAISSGSGGNIGLGTLSGGSFGASTIDLESSGTLAFTNTSLSAGSIRLIAGSGDLNKGGMTATNGGIYIHDNNGSLTLGNVSTTAAASYGTNANVDLYGYNGLTTGTITTSAHVTQYYDADATVILGTGIGAISAGAISTTALNDNSGNYAGSANAGVTVNGAGAISIAGIGTSAIANGAPQYGASANGDVRIGNGTYTNNGNVTTYYGGDVSTGTVNTKAIASNGSASAVVAVQANNYGNFAGTIIAGPITTQASATGGTGTGTVTLDNNDGGISLGSNAILAQASGGTPATDIKLNSSGGGAITTGNLTNSGGEISAISSGAGGNIGLGTLSGGSAGASEIDLESSGTLAFTNSSLSAGSLRIIVGSGDLSKGGMTATNGSIYIHDNGGSLTLGNVSATASASYGASADVDLYGYSGLTTGTITTSAHVTQYYDADATVTLGSTTGAIGTQAISTTALNDNSGNYTGSASAGVTVNGAGTVSIAGITTSAAANGAPQYGASANADVNAYNGNYTSSGGTNTYYGGDVDLGTVKATATASNGGASAQVYVRANYYGNVAGTINAGAITTLASATGGSGNGAVNLGNSDGGINLGSNAILAQASGGTPNTEIQLGSTGGGAITTGNLSTGGSEIRVTSSGAGGNISLGTLSGGSGGASEIDLESSGTLGFTNTSLSAGTVYLTLASGDLSTGDVTATSGGVYIHDNGGSLTVGNVTPAANAAVDLLGTTGLSTGNITASRINLAATAGNLGFGTLKTTNGNLTLSDTGGSISGGDLSAQNGSVYVDAYSGAISLGNVQASGSSGEGATAQVGIYSGGGLKVGSVSTDAEVSGSSGNAYGTISLYANYHAQTGGLLQITGAVGSKAVAGGSGYAAGSVYINNSDGGIDGGSNSVSTFASGGSTATALDLHAYNGGGITIGNLTALNSSINVSTGSGGDISVGTLSGGAGSTDALQQVNLSSGGALNLGGQSITATSISLTTGAGDLSFGNLTATAGNVYISETGGAINGQNITTLAGRIGIDDYSGSISLGNLSTANAGSGTVDASVGIYSGGGLKVGSITTNASTTGSGQSAYGYVNLYANYHAQGGGDLVVTGPISANAQAGSGETYGDAAVTLENAFGSIDSSAGAITTGGSGGTYNNAIDIGAYGGGNVLTGALTATNDSISVHSASGSLGNGDITVGTLSGGGSGDALTSLYLVANGSLTVNSAITVPGLTIGSGGTLTVTGDIDVTGNDFYLDHAGGAISLQNVSANGGVSIYNNGYGISTGDLTALNSGIQVITYNSGNIVLGHLSGGSGATDQLQNVDIGAAGSLTIGAVDSSGNPTALYDISATGISLGAGSGMLSAGNLTTSNGSIVLNNSGGGIQVGNLQTTDNGGHNSADASVTAYAAGGITVGSIGTSARSSGSVDGGTTSANGSVVLEANSGRFSATTGGLLQVNGAITTSAVNTGTTGNADGSVSLSNGNGGISAQDISTGASASNGNLNGGIGLGATAGDIVAGKLTAIDGADVYVTTTGSGNISVGQISASSDGELNNINLVSAGGLTTNGTNLLSQTLTLTAANGDLSVGDVDTDLYGVTVTDYGGKMTLSNVYSAGGIALYESAGVNGGIHTGDLHSADNIFITSTGTDSAGNGASVSVGTLYANEGTLGTVDIESSGGIEVGRIDGSTSHAATTAGIITLNGASGDITTGDLTGTYDPVTVSGANGNMTLGTVIADGEVKLSNSNGNITTQDLTSSGGYNVSVVTTGSGDITVGHVSGASNGSFASATLTAAGALKIGATGSKNGDITASSVSLSAGNGDLSAGNIQSTGYGNALTIGDSNGKITLLDVTAQGSITLSDGTGGIQAGAVKANQGGASVTVTTTGSGANVQLGSVSGGSSESPLSLVKIAAGGSLDLKVNGDITASSVSLSAGNGNLSAGNIDSTGAGNALTISDTNGKMTLLGVTADGSITLADTTGGIQAGAVKASQGGASITVTATGSGANVQLDSVSGGSSDSPLSVVSISAGGTLGLKVDKDVTANTINLSAGAGTASFGALDALNGNLTLGNSGGGITAASLASSGNITVNVQGAFDVSGLTSLGGSSEAPGEGALNITAGSVQMGELDNNSALNATGPANDMSITANAGDISLGKLTTLGTGTTALTMNASGGITTLDMSLEVLNAHAGGNIKLGNVTLNSLTPGPAGLSNLTSSGGTVTTLDFNSNHGLTVSGNGGVSLGNVGVLDSLQINAAGGSIGTGSLTDSNGSVLVINSGGGVSTGGINAGAGTVTVTTNGSGGAISVATATGSGDVLIDAINGGVGTGSLTSTNGGVTVTTSGSGSISLGALSGTGIRIDSAGAISGGNSMTATAGAISLDARGGGITVGNLLATQMSSSSADASIQARSAGALTVGSVTTDAESSGSNYNATGAVVLNANYYAQPGGDLTVQGPISTKAIGGPGPRSVGTALVNLSNGAGSIKAGTNTITTQASGGLGFSTDVVLTATGGGIQAGNLTAGNGGITATATGSGSNISLGSLSGGSGGALTLVDLSAGGSLSTSGGSFSAGTITLAAGSGLLSFGALSTTGGALSLKNTGGGITTGALSSASDIDLSGSGQVTVNGLTSLGNAGNGALMVSGSGVQMGDITNNSPLQVVISANDMSVTASSGNIVVGDVSTAGVGTVFLTLTANSGTIGTGTLDLQGVSFSANGNITTGDANLYTLAPGVVPTSITSATGLVKTGNIGTDHDLQISGGGGLNLGDVSGDGLFQLSAGGGTISTGNLDNSGGDVSVSNSSGAVSTGSITAGSGNAITVSAGGSAGNVTVGSLLAAGEGGALSVVKLSAGGSLAVGSASVPDSSNIDAGQITLAAGNGNLSAGDLISTGAGNTLTVSDANGKITLGNLTAAGDVSVTDGTGGIVVQDIAANAGGASVSLSATGSGAGIKVGNISGGSVDSGLGSVSLSAGGSLTSGGTSISAGSITLAAGSGLLSFGGSLDATSGALSLANSGGGIKTGALTASGALTLSAAGTVNTGAVSAASVDAQSSGGAAVYGDISSPGLVNVVTKGANLTIGNVTAQDLTTAVDTGNETVGNVTISGSTLSFSVGDVAGQSLTVGNLNVSASFQESLACSNCSLHFGNVDIGGGFAVNLGNGSFSSGSITAGSGDISLASSHGMLAFGNLSAANISLSTGQALTLSGNSIDASGAFSLSAGNTSLSKVSIDAGSSAVLTSGGTLSIAGSSVLAPSVTLNATGDISISGNSTIGEAQAGNLSGGQLAHASGTGSQLAFSSGGNISIDSSTLNSGQLSLNGGAIQLANGAALDGTTVALTGTGAVGSGAGSSTVNAGALSVKGASIDFSSASLTVGSGSANFGSDPGLLASIQAKNPSLLPTGSTPNASFAAPGGVTLGKLSVAGGYLFVQAPSLTLPSSLSGSSNMFVDYLPTDPAATLNVLLPSSLAGVTTLAFGGTPQTGDIVIGDGTQRFILSTPTNFVFATSGATRYPNQVNTGGVVLVLGEAVNSTPPVQPADLPLPPDQYTIDQPDPGTLAFGKDPGDINDPGVNDANKGRIDITTSTQNLSCGIGGVQ